MEKVVTPDNIQEVLASSKVVVVDFWATWCGPCRMLSPIVDEVAAEVEGKATVAKCSVEDCEEIAMQYGIRNIPTLLFFVNGEIADRSVGLVQKSVILDKINALL